MSPSRNVFAAAGGLVLLIALVGCSGGSAPSRDEQYTAPPATDAPAADALLPDGSTTSAGEWGVVRYMSTADEPTVLALKTTNVKAGEKGALGDVMVPGAKGLDTATPYYVSYVWVNLSGDDHYSPNQSVVAAGGADVMTLSVPARLALCDPPAATDYSAGFGHEQRGCAVVASSSGPPEALVFQGPEGSTKDVSFQLPTT